MELKKWLTADTRKDRIRVGDSADRKGGRPDAGSFAKGNRSLKVSKRWKRE